MAVAQRQHLVCWDCGKRLDYGTAVVDEERFGNKMVTVYRCHSCSYRLPKYNPKHRNPRHHRPGWDSPTHEEMQYHYGTSHPHGYGHSLRGAVMRLANQYQRDGMSRSEAIKMAWEQKGRAHEILMGNPTETTGFHMKPWMWLAVGVGGYLIWTKVINKPAVQQKTQ